ncbi:hypothetical protein ACFE04_026950 [Oxalis oulophora]
MAFYAKSIKEFGLYPFVRRVGRLMVSNYLLERLIFTLLSSFGLSFKSWTIENMSFLRGPLSILTPFTSSHGGLSSPCFAIVGFFDASISCSSLAQFPLALYLT